jgi:hypothetical protein
MGMLPYTHASTLVLTRWHDVQWVPLFEDYHVDLVVSGHTHAYLRGRRNGVTYTIVGGGGGNLDVDRVKDWKMFDVVASEHHYAEMTLEPCVLHLTAHRINGGVPIDTLRIASNAPTCTIHE